MHTRAHMRKKKKRRVSASALTPADGLTSQPNNTPCCLRVQVSRVSRGDLNRLQGEEKGWLARRPHPRIQRFWEGADFSIALALEALEPALN